MVGPSPIPFPPSIQDIAGVKDKHTLRTRMRARRQSHVESLPQATRALLFLRPPAPLVQLLPEKGMVGLYHARGAEAPTRAYARWLVENGREIALPWFADRAAPMRFRQWRDPFAETGLVDGPYGLQPEPDAPEVVPPVLVVPLLGFTARGRRLGQGGGHYDRWLAEHPGTVAIGLAWDAQKMDDLLVEPHDQPLQAVVTPTRFWRIED
ncbi:MAG: 5-formyltetrahydrofolate cyclo-ligase [Novosphingobium sp.]|nr:5-formyltetrahydrofolate cyclo-ligase [Novosphingobium sp.]